MLKEEVIEISEIFPMMYEQSPSQILRWKNPIVDVCRTKPRIDDYVVKVYFQIGNGKEEEGENVKNAAMLNLFKAIIEAKLFDQLRLVLILFALEA